MTDQQAYAMIGERAEELAKNADIQRELVCIAKSDGREAAIKYLYSLAIATLAGI